MSKLPRFMNFQNERAAPGRSFILHTGRPAWLAEVLEFDSEEAITAFGQQIMNDPANEGRTILASRSRKAWNGKHYFFLVIHLYEQFEITQQQADRAARLTRRMADWYLYNVLNS